MDWPEIGILNNREAKRQGSGPAIGQGLGGTKRTVVQLGLTLSKVPLLQRGPAALGFQYETVDEAFSVSTGQ